MDKCFCCEEKKHNQVPFLICGHYCCSECYHKLKSSGINICLICKTNLRRGRRSKILNEIYTLDMLYSA